MANRRKTVPPVLPQGYKVEDSYLYAGADAEKMVKAMKPGDVFTYHQGYLPFDREYSYNTEKLAEQMFHYGDRGLDVVGMNGRKTLGALIQRRVGRYNYKYIFVRGVQAYG